MARHIVQNNLVPKNDLLDPFKKRLQNVKRVSSIRKKRQSDMLHNKPIPEEDEKSESKDYIGKKLSLSPEKMDQVETS